MYTDHTRYLAALPSAKTTQELGQLMADLLGQCQLNLRTEGNLEVGNLTVNGTITGGSAKYAVATATWVRAAGHGSYVTCRAASGPTGTTTADSTPFIVYLPRSIATKDPNVYTSDVLQYVEIGGLKYAIGESYLDDKIGTLRAMTFDSSINGWLRCDGTGATEDHTGKFVRGSNVYGTTGGADSHSHTGSITTDNAAVTITGSTGTCSLSTGAAGGTTGNSTTGITIDDHPDHRHVVPNPCEVQTGGTYPVPISSIIYTEGMIEIAGTGSVVYDHAVNDSGHTHSVGSHTHSISPDPHSHGAGTLAGSSHNHTGDVTIDSANNVPAYINVVWYVRVGPAGEIT